MKDFNTACQLYEETLSTPRLFTGCTDLDMLLGGGLRPGWFHLLYGDEESGIERLIHQLIASSLQTQDKGGFNPKCLYMNCGNYREEKNLFDVELLTGFLKAVGLDPAEALNRIHTAYAFTREEEEELTGELCNLIKSEDIRLVLVHNVAKLFRNAEPQRLTGLGGVVDRIHQACMEAKTVLVATCKPLQARRGIPPPEGGAYLRHRANVILYLRREGRTPRVHAYLVKHPHKACGSVSFILNGGGFMGRVTIPFRVRLEGMLDELKKTFYPALMEQTRQRAFESLLKSWTAEQGAMSYCNLPSVLDTMLLTAIVDNRKKIMELNERVNRLEAAQKRQTQREEP